MNEKKIIDNPGQFEEALLKKDLMRIGSEKSVYLANAAVKLFTLWRWELVQQAIAQNHDFTLEDKGLMNQVKTILGGSGVLSVIDHELFLDKLRPHTRLQLRRISQRGNQE